MNIIKKVLRKIYYKIITTLPKKYIIYESRPDLCDNSKFVFDEMIKRKINNKYKMVWILFDENTVLPKIKNVLYISFNDKGKKGYYISRAKLVICCNRYLTKFFDDQKLIYLSHGNPIKNVYYYKMPDNIDYVIASSEEMKTLRCEILNKDSNKFIALGYPRNDVLTERRDISQYFDKKYKKIIAWYPTFRQGKNNKEVYNAIKEAVPIIHRLEDAKRINTFANENEILIVLKPHFAQDVAYIKDNNLSNIKIIYDDFFVEHKTTSYEFLSGCDALLTDYSSIYYDFTLCDKPIGLIWEGIEDFKENPGFAIDYDYYMKGGVKIYTTNEFIEFLRQVANNEDVLQKERREICKISNISSDGKSTERVVDFLCEKL